MVRKIFFATIAGLIFQTAIAQVDSAAGGPVKQVTGSRGMVVSAHPLASAAGLEMLKQGGNAFDAAIATQFALAVVYPDAGNLGGGGFMVARTSTGKLLALDYREKAPARAGRDMYIDSAGNAQTELSQNGHLSSGVPGSVAGIFEEYKYARLPMAKLMEPAICLAEKGFIITAREARSFNSIQDEIKAYNTVMPVFYKPEGWKAGDVLMQTDLANTLKRIRDKGAAGFYEGETAKKIVEEMNRGNGIISENDLKAYKAAWRQPIVFTYRGYTIAGMPMPSSGGLIIDQLMKMVEPYPLSKMGFQSPATVHLIVEAERRAYADRGKYMGDADFFKVPVKQLSDNAYIRKRMADFDPQHAGNSKNMQPGAVPGYESTETTHFSVADASGNLVSITTTLNNSYGSKTVVAGAGFFMNDEMDDFSIKPGVPNMYGAVGGEANAIMPGKRMLSSMAPVVVMKSGKPCFVVGTPGGTTIPTSVFQTLINLIDFNLSPADAVYKPKFHHQWLPDQIEYERDFPAATKAALESMGHIFAESPRGGIGRTELIVIKNGKLEGVADKRGMDAAAGF